jgi:hypothetical protein
MESELPFEVPLTEVVRLPLLEAEQRRLDSPDGCTLFIGRRGLTLLRGETTIDRWNGLVDVTNTPLTWTNPLQIGPLIITAGGFKRHREPS